MTSNQIALVILQQHASAYHVALTPTQRARVVEYAARAVGDLQSHEENQQRERHPGGPEVAREVGGDDRTGLDRASAPPGFQAEIETQPQKAGGVPV